MKIRYYTHNIDERLYTKFIHSYLNNVLTKKQFKQISDYLNIDIFPTPYPQGFNSKICHNIYEKYNKYDISLFLTDRKDGKADRFETFFNRNVSLIIHDLLHTLCFAFSPICKVEYKYDTDDNKKGDLDWYHIVRVHDLIDGRRLTFKSFKYWFRDGWKIKSKIVKYLAFNDYFLDLKYPTSRINIYWP